MKLNNYFLNNCKKRGVFLKVFIFNLPNVSNHDVPSIRKIIFHRTINKRTKDFQDNSKESNKNDLLQSKQLS